MKFTIFTRATGVGGDWCKYPIVNHEELESPLKAVLASLRKTTDKLGKPHQLGTIESPVILGVSEAWACPSVLLSEVCWDNLDLEPLAKSNSYGKFKLEACFRLHTILPPLDACLPVLVASYRKSSVAEILHRSRGGNDTRFAPSSNPTLEFVSRLAYTTLSNA